MGLCDCQEGSWNYEGCRPGTEKSSGLPLHLSFLSAVLLQHSSSSLQASFYCLPCDRKHGLVKILEFTWHASSQKARDQIFFFFLWQCKDPRVRNLIHSALVRYFALTVYCWKDTFLSGAFSVDRAGSVHWSAWAGNSLSHSTGSVFMHVTILMRMSSFSSKMIYIHIHEQLFLNQKSNSLVCPIALEFSNVIFNLCN